MAYDFTNRTGQYDAEEGDNQQLADSSGNGNNFLDSNSVPGGQTGKVGDARGNIRSLNQHFRRAYVASGPWDVRGSTSCTMAGWFYILNTEQQHVFVIDDPNAVLANRQAFHMILRETNTGGSAGPWVFMGDGISRFVGASLKVKSDTAVALNTWQFFAGGYDEARNKLFGFWGRSVGESYYLEVDGVVGGFGYGGTGSEALIGKFNGEAGDADMRVDHLLWFNGRALTESELGIVWNNHAALSFDELSSVGAHQIDNIVLESADYRNQDFTMSIMHRAEDADAHPYSRPTLMTGDYTSDTFSPGNRDWSARYIRNYYTIPPENFWQWYRIHGHADAAAPYKKEDAIRLFYRLYKENQVHHLHGPTVTATAKDTANLIPMSYIAKDIPKVADVVQWDNILQMENFVVETKWVPSCPHMSWKVTTNMFEVFGDANNYIRVSSLGTSTPEREYNFEDIYAPHEPAWRLEKVKGGSSEFTRDFILYHSYGGTGTAGEWMMEDTIKFQLIHFANEICQLRIFKGEMEGYVNFPAPVAFGGNLSGDFIIRGPGLWSAPLVRNTLSFTREATSPGRVFPIGRNGFARRLQGPGRNPILAGERDPNVGTINAAKNNPFIAPETFTRSDDANLGTRWFNDESTGNGWSIVSNKAECEELGWERYDHSPRHRDYIIDALVTLEDDNAYVGVFGRYERNRSARTAYVARVHRTSVTAATLEIVRFWEGVATVLSSDAFDTYAGATSYDLKLTLSGDDIGAKVDAPAEEVYTGATGVVSFTGSLVTDAPMTAGRVILEFTIAGVTYRETDDGSEGWNDVNGFVSGSSSINTTTGALELTFTVAPDDGTAINIIQTEASTSTTDIFLPKPGRLGIYGETDMAGELVQIDNYEVTRNHTVGIT